MSKSITELIEIAHKNAVNKGFYDCPDCTDGKVFIEDFSVICGHCGGKFIDPKKNVGELLMLIVSELGEALESHRNGKHANLDIYNECQNTNDLDESDMEAYIMHIFKTEVKGTFEEELADVAIRLFDLCGYMKIDLEKHIELKMQYNATREHKHGKKY